VAKLMGDGEGGAESVVLADAAAPVRITHGAQLGQTWRSGHQHLVSVCDHCCYHPVPFCSREL